MKAPAIAAILLASALASPVAAPPATAGDAEGGSHPHFDDKGTLPWFTSLADARKEAKGSGRLIFIEYGRKA